MLDNVGIKFDKKFLNVLKNNKNSGVEVEESKKYHLALHPIHLNNFSKSIKDLLNHGIAKYDKSICGVILGYEKIKLPSNIGLICNDSCYIHVDLEADFFVFRPTIGKEMEGVVNRKSKDHIGVLVYNTFNVSIPKPQMDNTWLGNSVRIGYEVMFRIIHVDFSSYLPYFRGELISIKSKPSLGVDKDEGSETESNKNPVNKKIIFDDEDVVDETQDSKRHEEYSEPLLFEKRKKSKRKISEDLEPLLFEKKKKSKRIISEDLEEIHLDLPSNEKSKKKKSKRSQENEYNEDVNVKKKKSKTKTK